MSDTPHIPAELADARLREMIDGCEGVTPGPWFTEKGDSSGIWTDSDAADRLLASTDCSSIIPWEEAAANGKHIARLDPETVKAMATELLAARKVAPAGLAVRPLEWRHYPDGFPPFWSADNAFSHYTIEEASKEADALGEPIDPVNIWVVTRGDGHVSIGGCYSLAAAKAAAQADYTQRILSAIDAQVAPAEPAEGALEADPRELLETLNEWFAQRAEGKATTNSEAVMWREVHGRLCLLDSFTAEAASLDREAAPPPVTVSAKTEHISGDVLSEAATREAVAHANISGDKLGVTESMLAKMTIEKAIRALAQQAKPQQAKI
jgi:hypothetical protein